MFCLLLILFLLLFLFILLFILILALIVGTSLLVWIGIRHTDDIRENIRYIAESLGAIEQVRKVLVEVVQKANGIGT